MLKISEEGLCYEALAPNYGQGAFGISPQGAMDQLSFHEAKILIGDLNCNQIIEIVYPSKFQFISDSIFVLTGAHYDHVWLEYDNKKTLIKHSTVLLAKANARLIFGKKSIGFRSYLAVCSLTDDNKARVGLSRGAFSDWFHWYETSKPVRVIEGPEVGLLSKKKDFLTMRWRIARQSDNMGLRLKSDQPLAYKNSSMISEAVADGTIQLTDSGPIVLLRHRQCTGGYPRIYNVISADIDVLAQYIPNQMIHFEKVSLDQALELKEQKEQELLNFKKYFL